MLGLGPKGAEMTKHVVTTIRYDGPALTNHQMDVQELAPALLALAEMVQLANKTFNGDTASMKVLVKADVKQQCFQLDIHLAQTVLESARHLFSTDQYKTAKEIAELLDLCIPGGLASGTVGGVFLLWKRLLGSKDAPAVAITTEQHGGTTTLVHAGDGSPVTVNNYVYQLASDPEMIALGKKVLKPLARPGYETLGFYQESKAAVEWSEAEAKEFVERTPAFTAPVVETEDSNVTPFRTVVSVKTQRNEGKAQWEIKWASKAYMASMEDLEWLADFQAGKVHFTLPYGLDVSLEMTTSRVNPDAEPAFAIKKVHDVINHPHGTQTDWVDDES